MDVRLYQKDGDGGEVDCVNGQLVLDDGLETSVYLSWFGGNEDDSGLDADKPRQWWANTEERDVTKRYRSELQHLLLTLPLIPPNLRRFEDAAVLDLSWMTDSGLASFVGVTATMPALNTVKLQASIEIQGEVFKPYFLARKNKT